MHSRKIFFFLFILIVVVGCKKDEEDDVFTKIQNDLKEIEKYLQDNNLSGTKFEDRFYYQIVAPGSGEKLNINSEVNVKYVSKSLETGEVISNSTSHTFLIRDEKMAWGYALPLIKKEGKIILYLPRFYASNPKILIDEIEIMDVYY